VRGPNRLIGIPDLLRVGIDTFSNFAASSNVNVASGSGTGGGGGDGGCTMIGTIAAAGRWSARIR